MDIVFEILENFMDIFWASWWFILPILLFFIVFDLWMMYIRNGFIGKIQWKLLEVSIPREILKTPKSMEQIFASMHAVYIPPPKFIDTYWYGKMQLWVSFEIIATNGMIRFYVRTPANFVKLVESSIYAQYSNAEISEAEDYINNLPSALPNQTYDLWGTEFILAKDNAYPIKTYPSFEEKEEERRIDLMASLAEVMSSLKADESIWIQLVLRPINDDWKKKGEGVINGILGKKTSPKRGIIKNFFDGVFLLARNLLSAPIEVPNWEMPEGPKSTPITLSSLTRGQQDVITSMEAKLSKLGFETTVRFLYIDKRESFSRANVAAVMGFFRQFNTQNMNSLKPNGEVTTFIRRGFFRKWNNFKRKRNIFWSYLGRIPGRASTILNTEELATIHHYPEGFVIAPQLKRIETKRGSPPPNLPIE